MSAELNDVGRAAAASGAVAGKWERAEDARDRAIEAHETWWYDSIERCRRCQSAPDGLDTGCYTHADYEELHERYLGPAWRTIHVDQTCRVCARITATYRGPR